MFKELYYRLYELLKKVKTNDNPGFMCGILGYKFNLISANAFNSTNLL